MLKRNALKLFLATAVSCVVMSTASAQTGATAPAVKAVEAPVQVLLKTSAGDIVLELNAEKAPKTVANFLGYVDDNFYNGTIFHRVIDGFMVQGGGFTPDFTQKATRSPIVLEADNGLKNDRGTVAMARTMVPNSATSQFFINVRDNASLNAKGANDGYAVFGKVVQGMDVVDKIRAVQTGRKGPHSDVPVETIEILSASRVE